MPQRNVYGFGGGSADGRGEMKMILGTLIQNVDINILDGFEPDFLAQIAFNPGERGMQMTVKFREDAPVRAGESSRPPALSSPHAA